LCDDKLIEYLYGELDGEDSVLMKQHLEASESCRDVYKQFESVREAAARQAEEEPPLGLRTRILARAAEKKQEKERRSLRAWLFHPAMATVAVASVAALVYVYTVRMEGGFPSYDAPKLVLQEHKPAPTDLVQTEEKSALGKVFPRTPAREENAPSVVASGDLEDMKKGDRIRTQAHPLSMSGTMAPRKSKAEGFTAAKEFEEA